MYINVKFHRSCDFRITKSRKVHAKRYLSTTVSRKIRLKSDVEINLKEKYNEKLKIINGNENLGDVYFLEATICTIDKSISEKGAILFPTKTVHKIDTIEFVAKNRLREKMNLNDNTQVRVSIDN